MTASSLPTLVLVHGWGFAPSLWQPLRDRLPGLPCVTVDLGFFGPESLPPWPTAPVIAVGHSLGVLWLLQQRPGPWEGLVAINGFPRFTAAANYTPGVPPRVLERMARRCASNAAETVAAFRAACGDPSPLPGSPWTERLCHGLSWLADWDACSSLAAGGPRLVLAGARDPILPPGMEAHFGQVETHIHQEGGHLLPLQDPGWCAGHIRRRFLTPSQDGGAPPGAE